MCSSLNASEAVAENDLWVAHVSAYIQTGVVEAWSLIDLG